MKKLMMIIVALVMALSSAAALAETKITVNGTGEVRVSADTAIISLGVNARDKDVLKAQQRVNETIAAIRTALIEQGVKEENINTDFINIYPAAYGAFRRRQAYWICGRFPGKVEQQIQDGAVG